MLAADVATALASILRGTRSADSLENQTLEFTTQKPSDKETCQDLAEAAGCFANSTGGRIVLGVADTTRPGSLPGDLDSRRRRSRTHRRAD